MAQFLNKRGKDFFHLLQQSKKMELLYYKKMGMDEVEIIACCPSCKKLEGKSIKIDDALKNMPLPYKNCTNILYNKKRGFCTCIYSASNEIIRGIRKKYE